MDNDIILTLATYDLFNNILQSLDIQEEQIKILDTFTYKFGKQIKRKRGKKAK
ncbi:hypothetical protein CY0110_06909 [Crocosphaera chwakensis CCY0110]|uniref:Uncharacterized protein n=1 Tax=Crocosphaera chwakensis CCY0110 TaxID=391612 RepID=A3IZ85_9CHRO|nr:hypothetical protein CY0110_06909 [Crocosphaera chwakensis CCY0110]